MKTGILGGTFDPIHIAHLHAGETALDQGDLDRVLFIPAGDPWQKGDRTVSESHHRVEMVRLAIEGIDGFQLDTREIERGGPTYTIDTLESFPDSEELSLIVGADAAAGIHTWHRSSEVIERTRVLILPRPGSDPAEGIGAFPDFEILEMARLGVSGTRIRQMAAEGRPFRFLVPEAVHDYIGKHRLYS